MHCLPASIVYYFIIAIHALLNVLLGFFFTSWLFIVLWESIMKQPIPLAYSRLFFLRFQKKWSENCKTPLITKWMQLSELVYNNKFKCHLISFNACLID